MKKMSIALGAALCLLALAPPVSASRSVIVDNDFVECPDADTNSIQEGVELAGAGGKVKVCEGVYFEAVTIESDDAGVHLVGDSADKVILDGSGTLPHGFLLSGTTRVTIEKFTVRRYQDGISVVAGSSGNIVIYNSVETNASEGIQLIGAGMGNHLKDNIVRDNGTPPASTAFPYPGTGILNSETPGTLVDDNVIATNAGHGVVVAGAGSTGVTVRDNFAFRNGSMNDHDGIRLADGASLNVVVNNRSERNRHDGVHLLAAHGNVVRDNVIMLNGTDPGPAGVNNGCGIDVENASSNNTVRNNDIEGHDRAGIRLRGSAPSTGPPTTNLVVENDVEENLGYGILLEDADLNTLRSNDSKKNGNDGLRANAFSAGNTFELNDMADNAAAVAAAHDCHDDSGGAGTAGTANLWTENDGKIQNRPGLCKDAAVVPTTHS